MAYGGTVNPPRNRKGGAGNPPPTGARGSALPNAKYYDKRPDAWNGAQDCVDLGSSGGFAVVANQMRLCASRAGRSLWAAGTAAGERALRRHKPQFGAQNRVPGDRTGRADSLIVVFRPLPQTTRTTSSVLSQRCWVPRGRFPGRAGMTGRRGISSTSRGPGSKSSKPRRANPGTGKRASRHDRQGSISRPAGATDTGQHVGRAAGETGRHLHLRVAPGDEGEHRGPP